MIIVIDNYNSFTYNIVQYLREIRLDVEVHKNDNISIEQIETAQPRAIVISPGPGTPLKSGISLQVIEKLSGQIPILGICLGHQCIGHVFGGDVVKAAEVVHGKTSLIRHNHEGIFEDLPGDTLEVTRYHSLIVKKTRYLMFHQLQLGRNRKTVKYKRLWELNIKRIL